MKFRQEGLAPIWDEIMRLAYAHWNETEMARHGQGFFPDKQRYLQFEAAGIYRMYTARDDGKLAGYAGMYLMPSMHTQELIATEDTYFLLPEYRKGFAALKFYRFIEREMVALGAVDCTMSVKIGNGAGRVLQRLGFRHIGNVYHKDLKHVRSVTPAAA